MEAHLTAIGRDVDVLVVARAVEFERVESGVTPDGVAAVARVPDEHVVAPAERRRVVAGPAGHHVVVIAAEQGVGALTAGDHVVAVAAVDVVETDRAGGERRGIDGVVAVAAVDDQSVLCRFGVDDGDRLGRVGSNDRAIDIADIDRVAVGLAVDRHAVVHRAVGAAKIDHNPATVGAADVVDRDVVRAAGHPEDDPLDAVEVHRDVVDVTGEEHPVAIGRDVDILVDVDGGKEQSVEEQRVHAIPAFDRVAAIARVPHEHVVTRTEVHRVVAVSAEHHVVVVAAEELVCTRAACDGVAAVAAIQECSGQRAIQFVELDRVVATLPETEIRLV